MNKYCLISFGVGYCKEFFEVNKPLMQSYADRVGMDTYFPDEHTIEEIDRQQGLPSSWSKIPLIIDALQEYDGVLWVDSDVIIRENTDLNVFDEIGPSNDMGCVQHVTDSGITFNMGFFAVRKSALSWLTGLVDKYKNDRDNLWWEQSAILKEMGYPTGTIPARPPDVFKIPFDIIDYRWNPHLYDARQIPDDSYCFHLTMFPDRLKTSLHYKETGKLIL